MVTFKDCTSIILAECEEALSTISEKTADDFISLILEADRVFFVGVGRVMFSLHSICKRFSHLGIKAVCVGDITEPAITDRDVLVVASGSGESLFPKGISEKAKGYGAKIVWIGSNKEGTIAKNADYIVRIPVQTKLRHEDEIHSKQPMTSLFEQSLLLFGDAIAMEIIDRKGIDIDSLWSFHANLE